jgi:hypothetical protein
MNYKEYTPEAIKNQDNYILKVWGDFDSFNADCEKGSFIYIPLDCLVPRSEIEFDEAEAYRSFTDSEIEVTLDKWNCSELSLDAELIIHDGHNRLKTLLANKTTGKIKCKIV